MSLKTKLLRKKYEGYTSPSTQIFGTKAMILGRLPDMTMDEYKIMRRIQTRVLKSLHRKAPLKRVAQKMPVRPGYNYHG